MLTSPTSAFFAPATVSRFLTDQRSEGQVAWHGPGVEMRSAEHRWVMATRLVIVADTHVPKRAREMPAAVWDALENADVLLHAGDWVDVRLLDECESRAPRLVGVYGNNDHGALRERLPEVARVEIDGVRLGVVHETGPALGREERCAARFPDLDVLVFGHSHIPWDTTTGTGLRLLNPGSPTDRRRQPHCTYLTAVADAGQLRDVVLHQIRRLVE